MKKLLLLIPLIALCCSCSRTSGIVANDRPLNAEDYKANRAIILDDYKETIVNSNQAKAALKHIEAKHRLWLKLYGEEIK